MLGLTRNDVILLAPAGNSACLQAALDAGADAVYFGAGSLHMRSGGAANFHPDDLPVVAQRCQERGVKSYLTLNTILYGPDLDEMRRTVDLAKRVGIDAIIASDMSVLLHARGIGLPIHLSVQANVANADALRFYAKFADAVVLSRELGLDDVRTIADIVREESVTGPSGRPVRLEIFAHGALCVASSGHCSMSLATCGESANRGRCLQPCRRSYLLKDEETGQEFKLENSFVMSPRDLCTIGCIDELLRSGATILKIEGRARPADYVRTAVSAYRKAIDAVFDGSFCSELADALRHNLEEVFHRGFWDGGFYLGRNTSVWAGIKGSRASLQKTFLGKISHFYSKISVAELKLETSDLSVGDRVLVTGNATGAFDGIIEELRLNAGLVQSAHKGDVVAFRTKEKARIGDHVYLLSKRPPSFRAR